MDTSYLEICLWYAEIINIQIYICNFRVEGTLKILPEQNDALLLRQQFDFHLWPLT